MDWSHFDLNAQQGHQLDQFVSFFGIVRLPAESDEVLRWRFLMTLKASLEQGGFLG